MSHLEDDYICWFDQAVGERPKYSDFVILHPNRGLLLLEVKDWKLDTIRKINKETVELLTPRGLINSINPHAQARQCAYRLVNQLSRDPQLVQHRGAHKGGLIMPYGFGVVLSSITRRQFDDTDLGEVLPETKVICKDEMSEAVEIEAFQTRLWDMFNVYFESRLTQPQIDRVRWHMFPEIRVNEDRQLELDDVSEASDEFEIPDLIKVMDLQQEKIARGLGEGHRVIHGVAGSGKTMILGYRCLHLAKLMRKPILVLCYNATLASRLRAFVAASNAEDRVNVYNIHRWCRTILKSYNLPLPPIHDQNFDDVIVSVMTHVDKGNIPKGHYGAILIDEGHDFKPEWLRLVVDMVDPDTKSLLLLYDDAQSIYKSGSGLGFSLKDVGVEAQGRTTILKLNYRNTREILMFAYDFVDDYLETGGRTDEKVELVVPDTVGRTGPVPAVRDFDSFEQEAKYVAGLFRKMRRERNASWASMSVVYCQHWMGKALAKEFKRVGVPAHWIKDAKEKHNFDVSEDSVKLLTMHSSKGLEFETVAACGLGYMGVEEERLLGDAKLLYVAMTRATHNLLLTSSKKTPIVRKIHKAADQLQQSLATLHGRNGPRA